MPGPLILIPIAFALLVAAFIVRRTRVAQGTRTERGRTVRLRRRREPAAEPARPAQRLRPRLATTPQEPPVVVAPEPEPELAEVAIGAGGDGDESTGAEPGFDRARVATAVAAEPASATIPPGPVYAPGWPEPGELAGFIPDALDALHADELHGVAALGRDDAATAQADLDDEAGASRDLWSDLEDGGGGEQGFGVDPATDDPTGVDARAWDASDWESAGPEQQDPETSWTSAISDHAAPSGWADAERRDQSDSGGEPAMLDWDAPLGAVREIGWPAPPSPGTPADAPMVVTGPWDGTEQSLGATVEALVTRAAPGSPSPVVVMVATSPNDAPTRRERDLERAVRRLEKRIAELTPPRRAAATPARSTGKRAAAGGGARSPFKLTASEEREIRALAARRSAPLPRRRGARIVLATSRGLSVAAIAERVGVHRSTVRRWQERFAADRVAGLR